MKKPETSLPEQYFTDVYNASSDPWNFETSDYEYEKYSATVDALPKASMTALSRLDAPLAY
jgi:hypothetical protein